MHIAESATWSAPYRCARFAETLSPPSDVGLTWHPEQGAFDVKPHDKRGKFATIADARHAVGESVRGLHELRDQLVKENIDLLITLGGMGATSADLEEALGALTQDAPYLLVAIPGDRESVPAHRSAVAQLAADGARIIDGSRYRKFRLGALRMATMPGLGKIANLIPGDQGCLHTEADVAALREQLEAWGDPALLLSYAPWRQREASASDYGIGGVNSGERILQPLRTNNRVRAIVHGVFAPQDHSTLTGSLRLGTPAPALSAGSIDVLDASPSALLLSVAGSKLGWKRLPVHWTP